MASKDKILQRMQVLGYSQNRLAKMAGVSTACICNILQGKRRPTQQTLLLLAEALCVPPSYLIDDDIPQMEQDPLKRKAEALLRSMTEEQLSATIEFMQYQLSRKRRT